MSADKRILLKKAAEACMVSVLWLGVWYAAASLVPQKFLISGPIETFGRIFELAQSAIFWKSAAVSLSKIVTGFLSACFIGTVLAALSSFRIVHSFLSPALTVIKSTPVASFTILALLWVRSSNLSTFVSFLMVLPVIYFNVHTGITEISPELKEMAAIFGTPFGKRFVRLYSPSVFPHFISAASIGMGFAWKAGIAAEIIGLQNNTIGIQLYNAKLLLDTTDLFAWTAAVIILSVLMEFIFKRLLRCANGD